ncbi:Uncharacterised protein [uncultured archaeon]|nr:Uncharacterised protein [uncultured archaeon]
MVNYEYRDLVEELIKGQYLVRESPRKEIDSNELMKTFNAIIFYNSHKRNFNSEQREGIELLIGEFSKSCSE